MKQLQLACRIPQDPLQKYQVCVCSSDGSTEYFNILAGVLQGNTLAPFLFIIYFDYPLRTPSNLLKELCLILRKRQSLRQPPK